MPLTIYGDTAVVHLSQGKKAVIDAADWNTIAPFMWFFGSRYVYAVTEYKGRGRLVRTAIHRLIMGVSDPQLYIDHADGNPLNNTRANLRRCTNRENQMNRRIKTVGASSQFKGVSYDRRLKKWKATICENGCNRHLGMFKTELEAAMAYDAAAIAHYGAFARPNIGESAA